MRMRKMAVRFAVCCLVVGIASGLSVGRLEASTLVFNQALIKSGVGGSTLGTVPTGYVWNVSAVYSNASDHAGSIFLINGLTCYPEAGVVGGGGTGIFTTLWLPAGTTIGGGSASYTYVISITEYLVQ